jgi:hypothetical protein
VTNSPRHFDRGSCADGPKRAGGAHNPLGETFLGTILCPAVSYCISLCLTVSR